MTESFERLAKDKGAMEREVAHLVRTFGHRTPTPELEQEMRRYAYDREIRALSASAPKLFVEAGVMLEPEAGVLLARAHQLDPTEWVEVVVRGGVFPRTIAMLLQKTAVDWAAGVAQLAMIVLPAAQRSGDPERLARTLERRGAGCLWLLAAGAALVATALA